MKISQTLKDILNLKDIKEAINKCNFEYVYVILHSYVKGNALTAEFTQLCLESNINPLDYINEIPDFYANHLVSSIKMQHLVIPNNIEKIGKWAFTGNFGLKSVKFPDNLKSIDLGAFRGCDDLKYIELPDSLEFISDFIFDLHVTINYLGTMDQWKHIRKAGDTYKSWTIKCIDGTIPGTL